MGGAYRWGGGCYVLGLLNPTPSCLPTMTERNLPYLSQLRITALPARSSPHALTVHFCVCSLNPRMAPEFRDEHSPGAKPRTDIWECLLNGRVMALPLSPLQGSAGLVTVGSPLEPSLAPGLGRNDHTGLGCHSQGLPLTQHLHKFAQ